MDKLIVCCFIGVVIGWLCGNLIQRYMRIREIQRRMEESQHNSLLLSRDFKDSADEGTKVMRLLAHRQFSRQGETLQSTKEFLNSMKGK